LKTVKDGPVVPDSFRGQLADVLHHGKVLLAGRALRYQIPLQVGGLRVLAADAGGQAENRKEAKKETASELTAHFWRPNMEDTSKRGVFLLFTLERQFLCLSENNFLVGTKF
jgi:hypothetical protein